MLPGNPSIAGPHVVLTFDVDGFSNWIGSLGLVTPGPMSRGEFEAIGLRRVLALLDEYHVPATFFVPGSTAVAFPAAVAAIVEHGHEVGHHGWVHQPLTRLSAEVERRVLERGLEAVRFGAPRTAGGLPLARLGQQSGHRKLLLEHGFEYDSSLMGNDVEPYWCRIGDVASQEEGFRWGTPVPLVELPVDWHLDDHPYFVRVEAPGAFNPGLRAPSSVLEIWRAELDFLCDEAGDGLLVFTLHPQVMGRGHLLGVLGALIEDIRSRTQVRFTTCGTTPGRGGSAGNPNCPMGSGDPTATGGGAMTSVVLAGDLGNITEIIEIGPTSLVRHRPWANLRPLAEACSASGFSPTILPLGDLPEDLPAPDVWLLSDLPFLAAEYSEFSIG